RAGAGSKGGSGNRAAAPPIAARALTRAAALIRMSKRALSILIFSMLQAVCAFAGVRHFTYLYEAPTSPPGSVESENWMRWAHVDNPEQSDELAFRHEIEIGITERFQASVYFVDWSYHNDPTSSGFKYSDSGLELIYNLSNPVVDPIGLSIYQEYR